MRAAEEEAMNRITGCCIGISATRTSRWSSEAEYSNLIEKKKEKNADSIPGR